MDARFSAATAADVDDLAALAARTFPLACPPELDVTAVDAFIAAHLSAEAFRAHLADDEHHLLCGRTDEGTLVAYSLLVDDVAMDPDCGDQIEYRPTLGISKFYLDRGEHGSGIATAMLEAVEDLAVAKGDRSVWLATNVHNERARRFYVRSGFAERGGRTFVVGGVSNTDVVYEKVL